MQPGALFAFRRRRTFISESGTTLPSSTRLMSEQICSGSSCVVSFRFGLHFDRLHFDGRTRTMIGTRMKCDWENGNERAPPTIALVGQETELTCCCLERLPTSPKRLWPELSRSIVLGWLLFCFGARRPTTGCCRSRSRSRGSCVADQRWIVN